MANDRVVQNEVQAFYSQGLSRTAQELQSPLGGSWGTQAAQGDVMASPMTGNATDMNLAAQVVQAYETGGAAAAAKLGNQFDALSLQDQQAVAQDINAMSGGTIQAGIQGDNNGNSTLLIGNQQDGFSQIDWGNNIDATGLTQIQAAQVIAGDGSDANAGGGGNGGGGGGGGW